MKRILSLILSLTFIFTSVNLNMFKAYGASSSISSVYGWYESIHIQWTNDPDISDTDVYYKLSSESEYTPIDKELIRSEGTEGIADIVGIKSGIYDIKITVSDKETLTENNISVAAHDRSGYGHFNYSEGIGGYNDDGTPKSDAKIIYVTNENKNSVKLGSYTGIGNILKSANKYSYPIIVRIIGTVDTQARDEDGTKTTDINNGVVAIDGLTDTVKDNDTYLNMLDVTEGKNITIEGIGNDAVIEKWGFTFKKCSSIEVRNLTFTKYPEDACSFSGSSSSVNLYKNFWVHNNYFKSGENKYDLTEEQDKHEGDGSSDFSGCKNITYSYNIFEKCHKTSLHGGSDSSKQYNSTWHHNYLINCGARLPLTRQVNLHTYNNYYYNSETCTDARASAWVFAEANYFENCDYAYKTTASSSYGDPVVKLYNNILKNSGTSDKTKTIVTTTDRTLEISADKGSNTNKNPYPNFDTDPSVFYYDNSAKVSDVTYLTDAETAKSDTLKAAGLMKENSVLSVYLPDTEETTETTTSAIPSDDAERYDKMELLIEQMMEEDGPENGSLWNKESESKFKWTYINGCMASAMMMLGNVKNDERYTEFADNYMSPFVSTSESSKSGYINPGTSFDYSKYTLDDLNSGKALIELIASGSQNSDKYTKAVRETLYTDILQYMLSNKTTAEGNLWHKNVYPYQVWLDGIYMETPFWLGYELEIGNDADSFINAADNVTKQIENVYTKLRNSSTGLYYHGYDAQADSTSGNYDPSSAMSWAETGTGHSASHWLRGTGWYAMALVDNIELMQKAEVKFNIDLSAQKNSLIDIYTDLMDSMLEYRDTDTNLWYQVIDRAGENYNYLETSGSAAMSYALMKGYNIGISDINYYNKGIETFRSLCDNKLVYTGSDTVTLKDICMTAGLAGPSSGATSNSATAGPGYKNRDGSYNYYVSEKTVENDAKGVAPLIFAYCQVLEYNKGSEPDTETTTAYTSNVGETVLSGSENKTVALDISEFKTGKPTSALTSKDGVFTLYPGELTVNSNYIDFSGGGNFTKNSIAVKVTGEADITIKYYNTGSYSRTLRISNSDSSFTKDSEAPANGSSSKAKSVTYTLPQSDTYYIYSTKSGIKVSEIIINYKGESILIGDVDQNDKIEKTDAALLLKHVSSIVTLTDEKQLKASECNGDSKYTLADVTAILKYLN